MRAAHDIGTPSAPGIAYAQRPDGLPDAELSTLAAVYRFVLDCHTTKKAAPESRPEDPERSPNEIRAKTSIPQG
jgi:hypothetical protein